MAVSFFEFFSCSKRPDAISASGLAASAIQFLLGLGPLGAVLGTALHPAGHALGIQSAADDVVTDAGEVLDTAAADHDHGVLLEGVAHAGNIGSAFVLSANLRHFSWLKLRIRKSSAVIFS